MQLKPYQYCVLFGWGLASCFSLRALQLFMSTCFYWTGPLIDGEFKQVKTCPYNPDADPWIRASLFTIWITFTCVFLCLKIEEKGRTRV